MAITPFVEKLLVQARQYDEQTARGRQDLHDRGRDEDYEQARRAILDTAMKLQLEVMSPDQILFLYMSRVYDAAVLELFRSYDIANNVPDEGISFMELAKALHLPQRGLEKLMRKAMAHNIYEEPEVGVVKHNAVSNMFRAPGIQMLCKFTLDIVTPSMMQLLPALEKWQGSQDPTHTAFNMAFGGNGLMDRFPNEACFKAIMSPADAKGLASYDAWQTIDKPGAVFVDVGGNHGYGALAIAKATQHMSFVVQDMDSVITQAQQQENQPDGILQDEEAGHRLTLQAYDIFSGPQPIQHADVYFFRAIFHNWSDRKCQEILSNLLPALKPGAHVVVCDIVLPEKCDVASFEQQYTRVSDLAMYALHNGWERTEGEWRDLFARVDPAFAIIEMKTLWPGSYQKFIHAVWN